MGTGKKILCIIVAAALALNLSVFSGIGIVEAEAAVTTVSSGSIISNAAYSAGFTIEKVDGLSSDFMMGVDISSIIAMEAAGSVYYDLNGNKTDIFTILADAGVNYIRVRVWNDPFLKSASSSSSKTAKNSYGGGVCSVDYAAQIGKRAAAAGMKLFVDFHYSDFWADPGKQTVPKAWASYSTSQIASAISTFTTESLTTIKNAGANIGMVQIGNETTSKICGQSYNSSAGISYFKAGCNAVRSFSSSIKIAIHLTNPEKLDFASYCKVFKSNSVDYDVLATSYYPVWHGGSSSSAMSTVMNKLKSIKNTYGKDVLIAETGYPYTGSSDSSLYAYGVSVEAQAQFMRDLIANVSGIGGLGVFYWEPAWISTGSTAYTSYGTGWANSNAKEYDSDASGSSNWAPTTTNTAMFKKISSGSGTYNFQALESLYVFKYVYKGAVASSSSSSTKTTTKSSTSTTKSSSSTTKSSTSTTKNSTATTKSSTAGANSSTKSDGSTSSSRNVSVKRITSDSEDTDEELTDENSGQTEDEETGESESTGEDSLDAESGENADSASDEADEETDGSNIGLCVLFGALGLLVLAGAAAIIATVIKKKKNLEDK